MVGKLTRPLTKSSSESRSENWSNDGRPWCGAVNVKFFAWAWAALLKVSPASMNWCSSSSPAHNVGRAGNSAAALVRFEAAGEADAPEATVRLRGSQKSKSCSEMTDRG